MNLLLHGLVLFFCRFPHQSIQQAPMMSGMNHLGPQGVPSGIRPSQILPDQQQQQYLRQQQQQQQQMLRVSGCCWDKGHWSWRGLAKCYPLSVTLCSAPVCPEGCQLLGPAYNALLGSSPFRGVGRSRCTASCQSPSVRLKES